MAHRPIKMAVWLRFLRHLGLVELPGKSGGSHVQFNYPRESGKMLSRPVVCRPSEKDIPAIHVKTNLHTLGVSWEEMEQIISQHC